MFSQKLISQLEAKSATERVEMVRRALKIESDPCMLLATVATILEPTRVSQAATNLEPFPQVEKL